MNPFDCQTVREDRLEVSDPASDRGADLTQPRNNLMNLIRLAWGSDGREGFSKWD